MDISWVVARRTFRRQVVLAATFESPITNSDASIETMESLTTPPNLIFALARISIRLGFPAFLSLLTAPRPRVKIGPFIREHADISSKQDVLTGRAATRGKRVDSCASPHHRGPEYPARWPKLMTSRPAKKAAFRMHAAGTNALGETPPIHISDSAAQRSKSNSTRKPSAV